MPRPTITSIRKRADFLRAKSGRKYRAPLVHLQFISSQAPQPNTVRVGYTVSKHCGNAVARNKIKRRLRHIMREALPACAVMGHDYVVIGREGADEATFVELKDALERLLKKAEKSHE